MKKITVMLFALSLFGLLSTTMIAQNLQLKNAPVKRNPTPPVNQQKNPEGTFCGYDKQEAYFDRIDPNRQTREEFEAKLAPFIDKIKADRAAGRDVQTTYNIPVVIHVIHDGDALGTGENITDAQAISQINVLNTAFNTMNATYNSTGANFDINFCIAQTDKNGVAFSGVDRVVVVPPNDNYPNSSMGPPGNSGGRDWETFAEVATMKSNTYWNPDLYFNFWTVRLANNGPAGSPDFGSPSSGGTLGFASLPNSDAGPGGLPTGSGGASQDGALSAYDAMGSASDPAYQSSWILNSSWNTGKTMVHEVGHWLGLYHPFQGGCSTPNDYCNDTAQQSAAVFGCTNGDTCPSDGQGNDPYKNHMVYSSESCRTEFTLDQLTRSQAVMANAHRRGILNSSTKCQTTTPIIKYDKTTGSIDENTNCNYTDTNFTIYIGKGPSQAATVTFDATGSTATAGADYEIIPASVNFAAGSTTAQNMTIRVYHDGLVEGDETINVSMVLNANGGDAVLDAAAKDMVITITDDDVAPAASVNATIFTEDFEDVATWTNIDADSDTNTWFNFTGAEGLGDIMGACGTSETDLTLLGGTGTATPNNYYISPAITIPAGIASATLKYDIGYYTGGSGAGEHYAVYFTTDKTSTATILAGTTLQAETRTPANFTTAPKTHSLTAFAGQTGYVVFRHIASAEGDGILLLDNMDVSTVTTTNVQTAANTATAYNASVPQSGTAHALDSATGNIIMSVTDSDNFNYGCNTISVSRDQAMAGAAAVNYGTNTANNLKVMAKSFTVTTANANPSGTSTLKFYFTDAEIAAWETATGNSRNTLKVLKDGGSYSAATIGSFGAGNVTLTANLTSGANGIYYFGKAPIPTVSYASTTGSANENTDCSYTDYTYDILLNVPASADATVTFNVTPGTATELVDYEIVNPTATFPAGTTTTQKLTIRVFNDGLVEGPENFNVSMTLNANGGDAVLDPAAQDMAITIIDNDFAPTTEAVQDVVNTPTAYNVAVASTGTVHATDTGSGNIMLSLTNNDAFDYGCTTVSVSRDQTTAGAPSVDFGGNTATNLQVMAKVFSVTTVNPNATGNVDYTFYFTEAEVAAWETATGNVRTDLRVVKLGDTAYTTATLGSYGTEVTLTASFAAGASGDYHFGIFLDPSISFDAPTAAVTEGTDCSFTDMTFPISIAKGASQNADVSFSVTGGSATDLVDYQIIPASVTFLAGDTTPQNLTVRVFHDGLVEGDETINVQLVLNANGGDAILNVNSDDMVITLTDDDFAPTTEAVQDVVNTATAYNVAIASTGTVNATDTGSGNIMLSLTNNDAFDYGCTTVAVSRDQTTAGAPAVDFGTNTDVREKVMAKVFTVTTANANATGNVNYTFYFTEAEIAAWETATGRTRSELKVIKLGDTTYTPATLGAYGTEVTLTASFAAGAAGDYHFGIDLEPTISFDAATGSITENSNCTPNFTDVTFPISIEKGASQNADITFNVTGGTATVADYQIIPASVTFLAGDATPQNLTVRVFHDGLVEGDETINVSMTLNANGGDAVLDVAKQDMTITINDDDVAPVAATVQDVVNTATAYNAPITEAGITYATDSGSGNIMLSVNDNDNFDYGCTTVSVSRDQTTAGAPSVDFGTNTALNLQVMAKSFNIATANANATGNVTNTFYFTEAEIAAWETATGNVRADLKVVKLGETIYSTATLGSYGTTDVTLTASSSTGAAGDYYFGIDANPTISFDNATGVAAENTNCSYTDVLFPISILNGATADADITFNVTAGTATQGVDYQIIPASVTFLSGTTTPQDMTIRVFHDGIVEGNETINVSLVLNANGGNAILDATAQDMVITINDDDVVPATPVQDVVNTATAYNALVSQTGTAYATDNTTGNVMLSVTDNDNFDYGCTTVSVSRDATTAGAPAVDFGTNTATNLKVMAKVFSVTTVNPNPTGSVDYIFYFTEAEIAAWEVATGNVRADLKVIKLGETTYTPATLGTYGTDVTLTASFVAGASGDYHFGIEVNPMISFDNATGTIAENTNCSFTDVTFPISIDNVASANADVSFMVTGGTATAGDYQIIPASVTFLAGTTTPQMMTVRVFHDGLVEVAETINVMMMLNANGGNATLDATKQDMVITINDDDIAPTAGGTVTVFTEDCEDLTGWTILDGDGDGKNWQPVNGAEGLIGDIVGVSLASETDLTVLGGTGTAVPNNYIVSPAITIPSGISSATLTYLIGYYTGGSGAGEHYEVYFTTDISSEAAILAGTVVQPDTITPASLTTEQRTNDMTALAGQTGYLVYRHIANPSGDGLIFLDTIDLIASSGTAVQSPVNTGTAYNGAVTGTGTAYATDSATGNIMLSITDNDDFNYGCTTVAVSRDSSTPAYDFGGNTATNLKVMGKVFTVTPTNASASGSVDFTFYFTEAEIASWESATGNVRADLKAVKLGSTTYVPVSIGAFGSDVTLTASFSTGAGGDYHFGVDPALSNTSFELSNGISIYPNPTKDVLNISTSDLGLPTSYTIYNSLGQVLRNVNKVSQADLTISTASYSNGVYFILIEKDGATTTKKFVKN